MSHRARKAKAARRAARRRLAPIGTRMPDADESMEIVARYFQIADAGIRSANKAADLCQEYFGTDPKLQSARLWYFASIGPVLIAAAMRKLNKDVLQPDDFWIIERLPGAQSDADTDAACQTVIRVLNDDQDTMHDLITAHYEAARAIGGHGAGHDALFRMVTEHLRMLASLIKGGAFPAPQKGKPDHG